MEAENEIFQRGQWSPPLNPIPIKPNIYSNHVDVIPFAGITGSETKVGDGRRHK